MCLAKPYFEGENATVMEYLIDNPNKKITRKMIGAETDVSIGKSFHKIVENLGFTPDLKKIFFKISQSSLYFRNPVTEGEFEKLDIPRLEIKKQ